MTHNRNSHIYPVQISVFRGGENSARGRLSCDVT